MKQIGYACNIIVLLERATFSRKSYSCIVFLSYMLIFRSASELYLNKTPVYCLSAYDLSECQLAQARASKHVKVAGCVAGTSDEIMLPSVNEAIQQNAQEWAEVI